MTRHHLPTCFRGNLILQAHVARAHLLAATKRFLSPKYYFQILDSKKWSNGPAGWRRLHHHKIPLPLSLSLILFHFLESWFSVWDRGTFHKWRFLLALWPSVGVSSPSCPSSSLSSFLAFLKVCRPLHQFQLFNCILGVWWFDHKKSK